MGKILEIQGKICEHCGTDNRRRCFRRGKGWYCHTCASRQRTISDRARKLGVPYDRAAVRALRVPTICPVLGIPLSVGPNGGHDASPSVDRIDPEKGYVSGNMCVISMRANRIKNNASPEELRRVADWLDGMRLHPAIPGFLIGPQVVEKIGVIRRKFGELDKNSENRHIAPCE
jgi:hypothetical protein